jgi:hypothetical protein
MQKCKENFKGRTLDFASVIMTNKSVSLKDSYIQACCGVMSSRPAQTKLARDPI